MNSKFFITFQISISVDLLDDPSLENGTDPTPTTDSEITTTSLIDTTTPIDDTDDGSWKILVGGIVGGLLGLAIVIALAVFTFMFIRTRRRRIEGRYRPASVEQRQKEFFQAYTIPLPQPEKLI